MTGDHKHVGEDAGKGEGSGSGDLVVLEPGTDLEVQDPEFDRLERFQALEPGHYWTAQRDHGEQVEEGDTLLLLDVVEFEGNVHSVTLRVHPNCGDGQFSMMVADFLDVFVHCPDGEDVRQREQQEVMQEITEMQASLMRTQSSPLLLMEAVKERVEKGMAELAEEDERTANREEDKAQARKQNIGKVHRRAARRSAAKGNPLVPAKLTIAEEVGHLIGGGINEQGVEELKREASKRAVVARAQAGWLEEQTKSISKALGRLTPYVSERSAVAMARASGAVKLAQRIKRGIESLDLYTGRNVEVYDIKAGADAPSHEPLTIVQGKRYAEEELAAWADVTSDFDFRDRKSFFEAMASNDDLLNQILPTPRCAVSVAMTRHARQYDDPLKNLFYNMENQLVFLLVRNGSNVHVVYSGSPSHEGASRLFPTKDELEGPFMGMDGERISIRDVEFGDSTKRFDEIALVYKRFMILLCGLDHRLGLFGRFYPAEMAMRFMSLEFQSRFFRFLADEDDHWLIGEELPPLSKWFGHHNKMLQSGSRVFVLRNSSAMVAASPELKRRNHLRTTDRQFEQPMVAFKDAGEIAVSLEARDRYSDRDYQQVKCYLKAQDVHEDAWWLCVDAVDVEDVRRYRHSRIYRSMGVGYLRLLRRLEVYLDVEGAAEQEAREYLLQNAVEHGGLAPDVAKAALKTAVRNWRAAKRGAALPGLDDKASLNDVLTLMVPEGHLTASMEKMLGAYLEGSGDKPLLLTRSGKAKLLLYVEASEEDKKPYPSILRWGWVKRVTLEAGRSALKVVSSSLVWLREVLPASEVEVRRWDGLDAWLNKEDEPIAPRKYASLVDLVAGSAEWESTLKAGAGAGIPAELFERLYSKVLTLNLRNRTSRTIDVELAIPVAAYSKDGKSIEVAYMRAEAETVMYAYGSEEQRERVASRFNRSKHARSKLTKVVKWHLVSSASDKYVTHDEPVKSGTHKCDWHPSWSRHQIEENYKVRKSGIVSFRRKRGEGGPCLTSKNVSMSIDRALQQLAGTSPVYMERAFYKNQARKAGEVGRWSWSDGKGSEEERAARYKAEKRALLEARYEHPYKCLMSPLVWPQGAGRARGNALFKAPMLEKKQRAEEEQAA